MLTNMTECVQTLESATTLIMKPNNYGKQNIYVENGYVDLVLFDEMSNTIIHDSQQIYPVRSFKKPTDTDPTGSLTLGI